VSNSLASEADPQVTLFTNVNVFDGVSEKLVKNANVVVTDNIITAVSTEPLAVAGGRVIDGGGRTLIPGLIDAHWHTMYAYLPQAQLVSSNIGFINIAAAKGAGKTLLRGFTTTREAGGGAFGVKQAIDRMERPATMPREISSRSDKLRARLERFRGSGRMPPVVAR